MAGVQKISFTSPYSAEEADIERRMLLAQMMQKQGQEGLGPTETIGGWAIKKSPLEGFGKAAQQALGLYQQKQLKEEEKALGAKARAEAMQWYGQQPQGTSASVQDTSQEGTGSFDMSGSAGPQNTPAQAPTQQQKMAWLLQGQQNPVSAPVAQMMLAQQLKMDDPYSLREGEKRYGLGGQVVAANEKPKGLHFGSTGNAIQGFDQTTGAPVGPATQIQVSPDARARLEQQQQHWENLSPAQRAHLTNESIRTGVSVQELMFNTGQTPTGGAPVPGPAAPTPMPQVPPAPAPWAVPPMPRTRTSGDPLPVRFSPEEEAANAADLKSPEARAELERELSRKDLSPRARSILQAELANFGAAPAAQRPAGPVPLTGKSAQQIAVDLAKQQGELTQKREFNMGGINEALNTAENILKGAGNQPKPTQSVAGSVLDKGGKLIGVSPNGAAQADQLRAIGGALVAKVPRMEGPQSNLDVELYKQMAGDIGNDTLPIERRLAALKTVRQLYGKYEPINRAENQPTSQDAAALQWANANPNDPRAAAIKQRLGR